MAEAAELREMPDDELLIRLEAAKEELFNLRFQFATSQLDNPRRIIRPDYTFSSRNCFTSARPAERM